MITLIKRKYHNLKRKINIQKNKRLLTKDSVSIISQNCIGGVFYHDMNREFLSPTINLFFTAEDFLCFINNLEFYVKQVPVIKMDETKGYPVGTIGDVRIHFMHYSTCEEAEKDWEKRKQRVNFDELLVLMTDRDGFSEELFDEWKNLKYSKILFTAQKKYAQDKDSLYFPEYESLGMVPDLIPNREFYKDKKLIETINGMN